MDTDLTLSSLRDEGHRITRVREEMVKFFVESSKPLSFGDVMRALEEAGLFVNKTTVYRELKFLLEYGYIAEVYLYPRKVYYELSDLRHHHHLVCEKCGKIDNITNCLVDRLERDVLKRKGFKIKRHTLEFYGLCSDCLERD